jgi:uncharacterized membrane protein
MSGSPRGQERKPGSTPRLARLALSLYPLAYRRRYGDEMRALLEDRPPRARAVLDLLRGALLAHLRPADAPATAVDPADRVRATASGVLMCWVFFAAAGLGFYKTTEDHPFSLAGQAHPLLGDTHVVVQAVALAASGMVVLGALPLICAASARVRRDPRAWRTIALPVLPLIVFGVLTVAVTTLAHPNGHPTTAGYAAAVAWTIAGLVCAAACVLACRAVLFATPVAPPGLRVALVSGAVVTSGMFVIATVTALYAVALVIDAGSLAAEPNGPFQVLSVSASLAVCTVVMVLAAGLAATATRRGWRVRAQLETGAS